MSPRGANLEPGGPSDHVGPPIVAVGTGVRSGPETSDSRVVRASRTEARNGGCRESCPVPRVRKVILRMAFLGRIDRPGIVGAMRISIEIFLFSGEGGIRTPETGCPV